MYGRDLRPSPMGAGLSVTNLVDDYLLAYNGARLREACRLFAGKIAQPDVTVGLAISGAITPTGLGSSVIVPLLEAGFVDWIVSTGANLYHDLHRSLGFRLYQTTPFLDDRKLRERKLVRIYDILLEQKVLLESDAFVREVFRAAEFQKRLSSSELHYLLGKYVAERERMLEVDHKSLLTSAWECGVPVYTSSPGDSTLGMNLARLRLEGGSASIDPELDVNETAAVVHRAKAGGGKSAVIILGGGSPKNYVLQTEPHLQEILGIQDDGHDYFIQITDARPDTGGLSGATPSEAVTWGKIDPERLPDSVVCYCDATIALPILAAYVLDRTPSRELKRLYDRRSEMMDSLRSAKTGHDRAIECPG